MANAKNLGGRPDKLTPEIQDKIILAVKGGVFPAQAAEYAGVCQATYYNWKRKGLESTEGKFLEFLESIRRAEATCEVTKVLQVNQAAATDVKAAMWLLERRFRKRWGKQTDHKHQRSVDLHLSGANAPLPTREEALARYRELTERLTKTNARNPK